MTLRDMAVRNQVDTGVLPRADTSRPRPLDNPRGGEYGSQIKAGEAIARSAILGISCMGASRRRRFMA